MKLIVDIDEQHFELLQMAVMNGMGDNAQKIVAQGIPLEQMFEQIRAEIELLSNANPSYWHSGDMVEREEVLDIIDKYREDKK